jgi:prophage regulatory protein
MTSAMQHRLRRLPERSLRSRGARVCKEVRVNEIQINRLRFAAARRVISRRRYAYSRLRMQVSELKPLLSAKKNLSIGFGWHLMVSYRNQPLSLDFICLRRHIDPCRKGVATRDGFDETSKRIGAKTMTIDNDYYLSVSHVTARLGVSRASLYRWIAADQFPRGHHFSAGCRRWKLSDVLAWEMTREARCILTAGKARTILPRAATAKAA